MKKPRTHTFGNVKYDLDLYAPRDGSCDPPSGLVRPAITLPLGLRYIPETKNFKDPKKLKTNYSFSYRNGYKWLFTKIFRHLLAAGIALYTRRDCIVLIHEALHACDWDKNEEKVEQTAEDLGGLIWKFMEWRQ